MEKSQLMKLGLFPLKGATQEDFELAKELSEFRFPMFETVDEIRKTIEGQGLPEEDLYLTTGLYDLTLFDGRWSFMEYHNFPEMDIAGNWKGMKNRIQQLEREKKYNLLMTYVPKSHKKLIVELNLHEIPEVDRRQLLIDIRSSSEYQFAAFDEEIFVPEMLRTREGAEDLKLLKEMHSSDILTIYRGETPESTEIEFALSWTTDLYYARFFAKRFGSNGIIYKAEVPFDKVLAYSTRECEVLVQYDDLITVDEYEEIEEEIKVQLGVKK